MTLEDSLLSSQQWRCIGPHRGGRSVAVAGDPTDPMTFYFGACAGGVWKTTDGGVYWHNISDGYFGTAAIGAVTVADADPNVIYVGTGEACIRNNVSHGDGVYKSEDGGRTWKHVGLADTRHIGCIRVHPRNPDLVYVAALGHAFGPNSERGVFRSHDGGKTWDRMLYKSERAGCPDLSIDPTNPRRMFASIWQVQRYPHTLENGGPESGLWRSTDGGDTWTDITRNPGLPQGVLGKVGVAISPKRPERVWALIEAEDGALFRSDDGGDTWIRASEQSSLRTRPWYYIHVFADPADADTCWVLNYRNWKSTDGGVTFKQIPIPHGDNHDLWFDPHNSDRMIHGNDGGACISFDGGVSWSTIYNQPTAQLYHVITDDQQPYRVYGSQQDNTAISVPSISLDGPISERDWYAPGGGESGYIAIKHDDPNIVVGSGPMNRRIFNHYMTSYDHRTRQRRDISVWPELYGWGEGAESLKYRFQWTFPILFSRHDPDTLYVASNVVHRSRDVGTSWDVISPDLTRNDPTKLGPSGGPVTRDNTGAEVYCTIFALVESPHERGVFWAGSDDGLIHVTRDGGATWQNVTPPRELLPEWALISIIDVSPHDAGTVYVAATRYKLDDLRPYLLCTRDYGATWTRIDSDIPQHEFTRVVREDPSRRGLLYAGSETGLYVSFDAGAHWRPLRGNLPVVPIYDLVIKGVEMVLATHGRSFWILDDLTPLHQLSDSLRAENTALFAPRTTVRWRLPAARADEAVSGMVNYGRAAASLVSYLPVDGERKYLDAGTNPAVGVTFTYYLSQTPQELRLEVLDSSAATVLRTYADLPREIGINRFVWNMRLPGAVRIENTTIDPWQREDGPLVLPGAYRARLCVDDAVLEQPVEIVADPRLGVSADDLRAQFDLLSQILARINAANQLVNRIYAVRAQVDAWMGWTAGHAAAESVRAAAEPLSSSLADVLGQLIDVHYPEAQLYTTGVQEKLNALFEYVDSADCAPPRSSYEALSEFSGRLDALAERFEQECLPRATALNNAITQAGIQPVSA